MLNPFATDYVSDAIGRASNSDAGVVKAATSAIPIKASARFAGSRLVVEASAALLSANSGSLPTPNGLAELASVLSGDLNFDDIFDHGSRQNSVSLLSHNSFSSLTTRPATAVLWLSN